MKQESNDIERITIQPDGQPLTKQLIWERKLLDFTLRNNLLNTRLGRRVVPFMTFGIDQMEDRLQRGEDYLITPCPGERMEPQPDGMYNSTLQAAAYEAQLRELMSRGRISTYLGEGELQEALKYVYRSARTAIEENGANSLFLTLGMLRWYETPRSEQPRYAPILLLPVDMVRRSGNNFVIRKRDEDIILNITLTELLKQNFNIKIENLKSLPRDNDGVDVRLILNTVREAVAEMERWDVVKESMLGLFSFNKFVMWNDIHTNADRLEEHPVIAALTGKLQPQAEADAEAATDIVDARLIDRDNAPQDFAIPLDVDSSQMEAVVESGRGRSFILHGPPGTGKSQTITNMIANALYQGRRVLFVAEKMAALQVVQARLEQVGLAPFCLELHSNKVTKKHFLEQMEKVLNVKKIKSPEQYAESSERLFSERKELIAYMEALHRRGSNGLSLYDCISEYLIIEGPEEQELTVGRESLTADFLARCREWAEQLEAVIALTGAPSTHPLAGLEPADNKMGTLDELRRVLADINSSAALYRRQQSDFGEVSPFILTTAADMQWLERLIACVKQCDVLTPQLLALGDDDTTRSIALSLIETGCASEKLMAELRSHFDTSIVQIDASSERRRWNEIQSKWLLPRLWAKHRFLKNLRQYGRVDEDDVPQLLATLDDYRQKRIKLDAASERLVHHFGALALRGQEQWQQMNALIQTVPQLTTLIADYSHSHGQKYADCLGRFTDNVVSRWQVYRHDLLSRADTLLATYDRLCELCGKLHTLTVNSLPLDDVLEGVDRWQGSYDGIRDWCHWVDMKRLIEGAGLHCVITAIEQSTPPRPAMDSFLKGAYHHLIALTIDENPQLRRFNGQLFCQQIDKYKQDARRFQELSKAELYSRLAARVPSAAMASAEGTELSLLKRNIANGGRGNSIRSIIDGMPTLLPHLCPCMLMSPLSVAQFLDLNTEKFDLVIFDEASQMPTSEAVGAIARGRSLIVVGDSKQMPPTSFFQTTQVDEDEVELDDMESILDDCRTLSMHEYYLSWHYRSKHESLIAFSNSQYYSNKLLTFPSVDDKETKVRLIRVKGQYDKGRTRSNPEEARAISEEVMRRLRDPELSKLSIGIVSFSKVQQDLIEDILSEELDKYPELKAVAYNEREPIFIKNLENVQGDERDVILFSVGYGPDRTGKVAMNFGPLNNSGGERRLNVAVSRARYEMMVFSALTASDIDLRRSHAKGVEGLKSFLEFAENGLLPISNEDEQTAVERSVLVDEISRAITDMGYEVTPFVGRSSFKIDIAVSARRDADGQDATRYLLGILCDGRNYYQTKTTRDREIVQPNVLQMLNWRLMRVYSIDWYENRDRVIDQIRDQLGRAETGVDEPSSAKQQGPPSPAFSIADIKPSDVVAEPERGQLRRDYVEKDVDKVLEVDKSKFQVSSPDNRKIVKSILAVEQPVVESYLSKRLAKFLGYHNASSNVQRAATLAAQCFYREPMVGGGFCVWLDKASAANFEGYRSPSPRAINEIPDVELMNAIKEALAEEFSLPIQRVAPVVARKFGYATSGSKITEIVLALLTKMEHDGTIKIASDVVSLVH